VGGERQEKGLYKREMDKHIRRKTTFMYVKIVVLLEPIEVINLVSRDNRQMEN